jgi:hypothetical protein
MDKRKQATLQRLQNPEQNNGNNLRNLRRETGRILGMKKEIPERQN